MNCVTLLLGLAAAAGTALPWNDPRLIISGRFYNGSDAALFAWPGVSFHINFTGVSLTMRLSSPKATRFAITVDGRARPSNTELPAHETSLQVCQGLAPGAHSAIVMLVSESTTPIEFRGIDLPNGGGLLQARTLPRRIEVWGDSDTVGFSIDGPYPGSGIRSEIECLLSASSFTDTSKTWATRLGSHLGAEIQVQAISGIGVTRSAVHLLAPMPCHGRLPECMNQALPGNGTALWDPRMFTPEAILVLLGANDFVNLFKPTPDQFITGYRAFLTQLHQYHANKAIPLISVCAGSGLPSSGGLGAGQVVCPYVRNATAEYNAESGDVLAHHVELPEELWGRLFDGRANFSTCLDHWSVRGQELLSEYVNRRVSTILGW